MPALVVAAAAIYAVLLAVFHVFPRYDCLVFVGLVVAAFRVLDRETPRARMIAVHAMTLIFVVAFLVHLWTLGYEGRNAVFGGILPWSDSRDFLEDAIRFDFGERFTEASSKRPIMSVLLAAFIHMTGSLRVALAIFAMFGAFAIATAALEVQRTHGYKSALVVYGILLFCERRWAGFIQTEHVGLPLGAIAFTLIWRANYGGRRPTRLTILGLATMAVGLMARAGAFFVLPAIALWGTRRSKTRARFAVLAFVALALAFATHKAVLSAAGRGVTFSDYPGIFYGLMHDEDYTYLAQTHPAIGTLPVDERVSTAWKIVTDEARADPGMLAAGFARSGAGLFVSPFGMFSYVWTNPDDHVLENGPIVRAATREHGLLGPLWLWRHELGTYSLLNAGAMGLLGGGFVIATLVAIVLAFTKRRRDPSLSLLRHVAVGVIASAPFTPPWITSGQQVQTVTLAFVAALPAALLLARRVAPAQQADEREGLLAVPPLFLAVLAAAVIGVRLTASHPVAVCDDTERVIHPLQDTLVEVTTVPSSRFSEKALAGLTTSLVFLKKHNHDLTDSIVPYVVPGTRFVAAYDLCDAKLDLLVDDRRLLSLESEWIHVSAPALATTKVRRVDQATPVEP